MSTGGFMNEMNLQQQHNSKLVQRRISFIAEADRAFATITVNSQGEATARAIITNCHRARSIVFLFRRLSSDGTKLTT
jgi:ABC-type branched-subunit amino acid transport system ATPase component